MGKIFPLSQKPSCYEETVALIERSFGYQSPHSFKIDFAPLIDESNFSNCYILLDDQDKVVAHIGVKEKFLTLKNKKFPVTLLGGIAVDEARRGEGIFQELFQDVLAEKRSDSSCFLLWSDLEKLYNKFGFYLCGTQYELTDKKQNSPFLKTTFSSLTTSEQKEIKDIYQNSFAKAYLTLDRSEDDWQKLALVTSAELYLRKENEKIQDYYFMGKGQDLPEIIYEYGSLNDLPTLLKELTHYGKVWLGKELLPSENQQYQFFMAPGDKRLFADLISHMTNNEFIIRDINIMKQEVYFDFQDETISLEVSDFLRGVFGPGQFEELDVPTLFLSGLESI